MKNFRTGILFFVLVGCIGVTGCAKETEHMFGNNSPSNAESDGIQSKEYKEKAISGEINENDGQFMKDVEEFADGLNLDGSGNHNDSVRVTSYENQNDIFDSYVVLEVILNQDETIQKKFTGPHKYSISVTHGNLFTEDREGFAICMEYFGSNYGASDVYAYEVVKNNGKAELVERLSLRDSEGDNDSRRESSFCLSWLKDEFVFDGEVYFIEELNQDGIRVQFYVDREVPAYIIYWKDDEWEIFRDINERMIPEQSFDVFLEDWGEVTFVTCEPYSRFYDFEDATFFLVRDNQILYRFPWQFEDNNLRGHTGAMSDVGAVSFRDINNDKKKDIIIIKYYVVGMGWNGMKPRPFVTIYLAGENEFYLAEEMIADVEDHIEEKDRTIENICNYLKHKE